MESLVKAFLDIIGDVSTEEFYVYEEVCLNIADVHAILFCLEYEPD